MINAVISRDLLIVASIDEDDVSILFTGECKDDKNFTTILASFKNMRIDNFRFLLPTSNQKNYKINAEIALPRGIVSENELNTLTKAVIDILPKDRIPVSHYDATYTIYSNQRSFTYSQGPLGIHGHSLSIMANIVTIDEKDYRSSLNIFSSFKGEVINTFTKYQGFAKYNEFFANIKSFQLLEFTDFLSVSTIDVDSFDHVRINYSIQDFYNNISTKVDCTPDVCQKYLNYLALEDDIDIFKDNNDVPYLKMITAYEEEIGNIVRLIEEYLKPDLPVYTYGFLLENDKSRNLLSRLIKRQISTWVFNTIITRKSSLIPLIGGLYIT